METDPIDKRMQVISWGFQIVAAVILAIAAWGKITGAESSVFVFSSLKMEPSGRIIIGIIESLAALMLITTSIPHLGAILGFAVMIGATFAHISVLGIEVQNDGGRLVMMLAIVVVSTLAIMYFHRRKLPLIGKTFE